MRPAVHPPLPEAVPDRPSVYNTSFVFPEMKKMVKNDYTSLQRFSFNLLLSIRLSISLFRCLSLSICFSQSSFLNLHFSIIFSQSFFLNLLVLAAINLWKMSDVSLYARGLVYYFNLIFLHILTVNP